MSTKSKLLAMTENLQLPPQREAAASPAEPAAAGALPATASGTRPGITPAAAASGLQPGRFPPVAAGAVPRTAPGQMLQFRGQMLAVEGELERLRGQLKTHEGATPTRRLDPALVLPSRWANRHPDAFKGPEFIRLKRDIELAGGNVQPIGVRPLAEQADRYEIIFGHRRHRACSELGLPVLAMIETHPVSDLDLFAAMDRENRERADLSPYEQGMTYRRALDEKLYPSNRRLAEALGVSHTWVANVLAVADLPPPVLACFRSPLEVQHRHAKAIAAALDSDRKGVLRRAEKLRSLDRGLPPGAVVATLVGTADPDASTVQVPLVLDGQAIGRWSRDRAGRLTIQFDPGVVADGAIDDLAQTIARALVR